MDAEEILEKGGTLAVLFLGLIIISSLDFSSTSPQQMSQNAETMTRFFYAGVMTIAPTSELAIMIDIFAALISSVGLVKGANRSLKQRLMAVAFLYFFVSLILNYLAAPF